MVDVLGEESSLHSRFAVEFGDLVHRGLHACGHVTDASEGCGHCVGTFSKGDQLATSIGELGKLEWGLSSEFTELRESLFGFGGIADERSEGDFRLFEVSSRSDRLHSCGQCYTTTGQCRAETDFQPCGCEARHFFGGGSDHGCGSRHRSTQGSDVSSKGDGECAHAPGVESTHALALRPVFMPALLVLLLGWN